MNEEFKIIFFALIDKTDNIVLDELTKQIIKEKFANAELRLSLNGLKEYLKPKP